jgi:peptidoglycan/xylan/chitin deacetylase (PgdA/CDA1 family)
VSKHKINILLFVLLTIVAFVYLKASELFVFIELFLIALFFITVSLGVVWPRFNYFIKAKHTLDGDEILLTFDDGPHPVHTPMILDVLKNHDVKAVFFVIGKHVKEYPDILKRISNEGHLTGNHTFDHHALFSLGNEQYVRKQLEDTEKIIAQAEVQNTGLFRPPVGYTNPIIARVATKLGLRVLGWNFRSYDTIFKDPDRLLKRLLRHTKKGGVVLLHDNLPQTVSMLDKYLSESKLQGYQFANEKTLNNL